MGESCYKHAYESKAEAKRVLARARSRPGRSVRRTYRCPSCGKWHLTNQEKRSRT